MPALFDSQTQNPIGLNATSPQKIWATLRGGSDLKKGAIVRFDLAATDGAVTASTSFGSATSPTANVLPATNSHDGYQTTTVYLYGILDQDLSDDESGWVIIRGVCQARGGDSSGAGVGLTAGADSELVAITDGRRCCAIALETMADNTLGWVIFDGINGFNVTNDVAA